ncbi:MAG: hypothetical protein NTV34_02835, partial [Proteobacteria bacterium]|nr:hypothetical protein [Pseudomonadota bacterium]
VEGNNDVQREQTTEISEGVRWFGSEDPNCKDSVSVSSATIYEWNGTAIVPKVVPMKGQKGSGPEFASSNIIGTLINASAVFNCDGSLSRCKADENAKSDAKELVICRSNGLYKRESLEGMTLTSQYFTETAYQYFNAIPNHKPNIKPSVLVAQPKIQYHVTKKDGSVVDRIITDNAAFSKLEATKEHPEWGMFRIYPTSQKSFTSSGLNLWEVPFVMHHEFGHHVFRHYVHSTIINTGLTLKASDSLDTILPLGIGTKTRTFSLKSGTDSNAIAQNAVDGINETFADLYSYFSNNSVKDQLKGVDCLALTRDPASAKTATGIAKGLDAARMAIYLDSENATDTKDCNSPSFDDEHDIATALGQPIAKFIEDSMPSADSITRGKVLLNWATRMNALFSQGISNITIDTI